MRTLLFTSVLGVGLVSSFFSDRCQAQATVVLGWSPSTAPNIAGYNIAYGLASLTYTVTNYSPGQGTNATITNLQYGVNYYFAVAAVASNGLVSTFSSEVMTNVPQPPAEAPPETSAPPPPGKSGGKTGTSVTGSVANTGGNSGNSSSGSGTGSTGSGGATPATALAQAQIWGVPPMINLTVSNGQPTMAIAGTVGATVNVQCTTNPAAPFSWTTLTNFTLTNVAGISTDTVPGQPQDAIDLAYVPALQAAPLPTTTSAGKMQFFRVTMPYDYTILASQTLPPQGYSARLILVNLTGLNDDACYVSQAGSFIHFVHTNSSFQLETSGSTIRQIATTLANNLNLDWTTASEFLYTNGVGQILATVVEADPPSSDPVAGQNPPTSTIAIDF